MSYPTIVGVDYSITSPAVTVASGDVFSYSMCQQYFVTTKPKYARSYMGGQIRGLLVSKSHETQTQRFKDIAKILYVNVFKPGAEDVYVRIEGYAFAAKGAVFNIAENTGVLKYMLDEDGIPFDTIAPTELKSFASGKGNADKALMHESFYKETGVDLAAVFGQDSGNPGNPTTDLVDSYFIAKSLWYAHKGSTPPRRIS